MSRRAKAPIDDGSGARSCLLMLAIYATLSVVYTLGLQLLVSQHALPLALVLAIFGSLFVGSLVSVATFPDESRWIRDAARGLVPRQGALAAVCGKLAADPAAGELVGPISDEPVLAWDAEVYDRRFSHVQNHTRKVLKYKGMARVPLTCDGRQGPVRISGLLDLGQVKPTEWRAEKVMPNLGRWAADPRFDPFELRWKGVTGHLEEYQTRDDDYHRLRFDPRVALTPDHRAEERALRVGQEVCALGVWDRQGPTLRGRRVLGVERVVILPGSPGQVLRRLQRKTWLGLAAMTFLFLLSHGLVVGVLFWGLGAD